MKSDWLDTSEYPFTSKYFTVNGQNLHYIDEGQGHIIMFVHGTPSWSFDFRKLIKSLRLHFRCIAIDHIGFGLSNKPEHYDYSTQNHSKTLEKFILEKELDNFTLLVHDFGGPIGLNFALQHPERIQNLIILNTWLWSSKADPEFIKFSKILKNPLLPFLYRYLNFSPKFILPQSFGEHKISNTTLNQYTKPFASSKERNGALAFVYSLLNDQDWFEELWKKVDNIKKKPTLLIWGMKDPVIKPHMLDKFESKFYNSTVLKLATCGHFPQEEDPDKIIESLLIFIPKNGNPDGTTQNSNNV